MKKTVDTFVNVHQHSLNALMRMVGSDHVNTILNMWTEPHRYYHTLWHLDDIFNCISSYESSDFTDEIYNSFLLAALYHDCVYDPKAPPGSGKNEDDSLTMMKLHTDNQFGKAKYNIDLVSALIEATKAHHKYKDLGKWEKLFVRFDLNNLAFGGSADVIAAERRVFKEYQFVDYSMYRHERIRILSNFVDLCYDLNRQSNIEFLIKFVEQRTIKIGIYPGTFYRFHRGHYDILKTAEKTFDKVIVAVGFNPDKTKDSGQAAYYEFLKNSILPYHQVDEFHGLLTDYLISKTTDYCTPTIVKGLRPNDYDYERYQLKYMREFMPDVNVIYIPASDEFDHISSSALKSISNIPNAKKIIDKYLVKKWPDAERRTL